MSYRKMVVAMFVLIALLLAGDIWSDLQEGLPLSHVAIELVAFLAAAIPGSIAFIGLLGEFRGKQRILEQDIQRLKQEKESWQQQAQGYLRGLGEAIDIQFERWGFSPAEKEIGLLILKGLSHKEIANLRGTVEKTVRQQAGALYAKAGLEGKSQLAAFFLDDLDLMKN